MAIRVGRWDCTVCGTKGNLGPETRCRNCGASRPPNVKFYLPDEAEVVQDEARLREARAGVDWICGHCQSQNKAADTVCFSCANPRDELSQDVDLQERTYGLDEVPTESFERERTVHPLERPRRQHNKPPSLFSYVLVAVGLLLAAMWFLRTFPQEIDVVVEDFEWKRQWQLLHYEAVQHEDWSTPSGAFEVSSFQAVHHYDQVLRGYEKRRRVRQVPVGEERYVCGQIDRGNGYFEDRYCTRTIYENREEWYEEPVYDQVPVYRTKYRYKLMQWVASKENLLQTAAKDHQARWPEDARLSGQKDWKGGEKKQWLYVWVREADGDLHQEEVDEAFWQNLTQGQTITAKRSYLFDIWYGLVK
ncbi:MAG: zinc finger protein [Bacteroidota bacterium]